MRRLARFSLFNRALVALITVFVLVFGVLSARALKQELIPSLQLPVAAVVTTYPGASPAVVDEQISRPLADAVKTVDGLEKVTSTASSGSSVVSVQVKYGTDLDRVQSQLQSAVNRLQSTFPDTADSQVIAGSFDDFPVIQLAVASDLDAQSLKTRLDATAVSSLSRLDGVRDVTVSGARALQVRVDLDQAKLRKQNLTATDVTNALQTNGTRRSGGQIDTGGDTLSIDVGVPFGTVQQIRDLPLVPSTTATPRATPGANPGPNPGAARAAPASIPTPAAPKPTALSQVATVTEVPAPATGYARVDGKPALTLGVTKTPDGNTVTVSDDVRAQLAGISEQVGGNTTFTVVFDQAPFITQSIDDLTTEGVLGLVMAIVVILVFLLSVRSTLVTAVSIPMSLLVTMIVLRALGYSLNILTLAALTIAIGRVVDDSIVVIENIKRHLAGGEEKLPAILTAIGEVAGAVTASTATTVAVFAPIAFVGGQVGELFRPFAVTVAVALLASLFVSLTIVPVLAYWWLGSRRSTHPHTARTRAGGADVTRLQRGYLPVLTRALRHPIVTIAIAVLILGGTVALVPQLQTNFLGDSGQNTLTVSQNLPAGSSLASTDRAARSVETAIGSVPGVATVLATVGSSGNAATALFAGGGGSNQATYSVTLDPDADADAVRDRTVAAVDRVTDAGEITVSAVGSGFGSSTVDVIVTAPDEASLAGATKAVRSAVDDTPGTSNTSDNLAGAQPVVGVVVDRRKAVEAGTTEAAIQQQVSAQVNPATVATLTRGGNTSDVVLELRSPPAGLTGLRDLVMSTPTGTKKLSALANVDRLDVPTSVTRTDGDRSATVSTTPRGKDLGTLTTELTTRIDALALPGGAQATVGGVSADQQDSFRQLALALLAAIAIVYVLMVATFKSLIQPLILLVSVPFAATGALVGLLLTDTPLGVPALIGLLMLVGIVVTNAIVLIDLVNQRREAGAGIDDAVIDGARLRLRPILMTAVATIFALVPMSLGLTGGGAFVSRPLAIVVIGGLFSSTLLTLVLVPVLYRLVERLRTRRSRRRAAQRAASPEPAPDGGPDGVVEEDPSEETGTSRVGDSDLSEVGSGRRS